MLPNRLALVAFLATLSIAPAALAQQQGAGECAPPRRAELEQRMQDYLDAFNSHDLDALGSVLAPDYWTENPLGVFEGLGAIQALMEGFFAAFPDLHYSIERVLVVGDQVVLEYSYTGTHLGPLMGVSATGIVVHGRGMEIHRVGADGRLTHTWNYSDIFGLFAQLGLI